MFNFAEEIKIFKNGYDSLGAIDEAGRGPLAGPVVAACVVAKNNYRPSDKLRAVNDSKKLSVKKRKELYTVILEEFFEIGVGICDCHVVDKINVLQATFLAMKKAIGQLKSKPAYIILDGGLEIPNFSTKQRAIKKGDSIVFSIAAASIIAKETRDNIMLKMNELYPNYAFDQHKGYGTKKHLELLKQYGPCPIHRKTFAGVKELI